MPERTSSLPQNIAEFRIIGRIGKIRPLEKVTYVSVASNYNRRDGDDWKTDTHWNSVVCFPKIAAQVENAEEGDLVHITGRTRENSHSGDAGIVYKTELIADSFSILARKMDEQDNLKRGGAGVAYRHGSISAPASTEPASGFVPYG